MQAASEVRVDIPEKLLWLASKPKRVKIAVGGRGSGKSTGVGDLMLGFAAQGERICCAREFQNSIDDSVHESLKIEIARLGLDSLFDPKGTEILSAHGGHIIYKGLARNITSIKSIAGINRLWIEEGESVSEKSLKVLTPSIRSTAADNVSDIAQPPEIWITMNRGSSADAVAKKYLSRAEASLAKTGYYEDDLMMVVDMNYDENPWFPTELEQERQDDYENLPRAEYDHIWLGRYADSIPDAIIQAEWFDACIDAHVALGFDPAGQERVAYDPADSGDAKAVGYQWGSVLMDVMSTERGDIASATDWATTFAIERKPDVFTWDVCGMGMGLKRQITDAFQGKKIDIEGFNAAEGPDSPEQVVGGRDMKKPLTNKQRYANKRAQYYGILRDAMYRTYLAVERGERVFNPDELISFSSGISELEGLRAELCRIPRKFNRSGRFELYTKQDMKTRFEVDSPNRADVVMMLQRPVEVKKKATKIKYKGWG